MADERITYQDGLRALGAELDARDAARVRIRETGDGFRAVYVDVVEVQGPDVALSFGELRSCLEAMRTRKQSPAGDKPPAAVSYQNALRALGYELDRVVAAQIEVEELQDAYLVQYYFHEGPARRERHALFGPVSGLLEDAYARRRPRLTPVGA